MDFEPESPNENVLPLYAVLVTGFFLNCEAENSMVIVGFLVVQCVQNCTEMMSENATFFPNYEMNYEELAHYSLYC